MDGFEGVPLNLDKALAWLEVAAVLRLPKGECDSQTQHRAHRRSVLVVVPHTTVHSKAIPGGVPEACQLTGQGRYPEAVLVTAA